MARVRYLCGDPGHADDARPDLTPYVCSALRAPAIFVGEVDLEDRPPGGATGGQGEETAADVDSILREGVPTSPVPPRILALDRTFVTQRDEMSEPRVAPGEHRVLAYRRGEELDDDRYDDDVLFEISIVLEDFLEWMSSVRPDEVSGLAEPDLDESKSDDVSPDRTASQRRPGPVTGINGGNEPLGCVPRRDADCWPYTMLDYVGVTAAVAGIVYLILTLGGEEEPTAVLQWVIGAAVATLVIMAIGGFRGRRRRQEKNNDTPWRVVITCPIAIDDTTHRIVFDEPDPEFRGDFVGPVASESDRTIVSAYGKYANPDDAADRIKRQSTFILGSQAFFILFLGGVVWRVTTTDGTATGVADIDEFVRNQATPFSIAIAALATSFAMAILARSTGAAGAANLRDQAASAAAMNRVIKWRTSLVQNAAIFLGLSLLLAVAVPIAAANDRETSMEISAPEFELNEGGWTGSTTVEFNDLGDDERVAVAAWEIDSKKHRRALAIWTGIRPDGNDDGDALTVPLEFRAEPDTQIEVAAYVTGGSSTPGVVDSSTCDEQSRAIACARFEVPGRPEQPITLEPTWTVRDDGLIEATLTAGGAGFLSGEEHVLRVWAFADEQSTPSTLHRSALVADAAGAIQATTVFTLDPRRERILMATTTDTTCAPPAISKTCFQFRIPVPADVEAPVIEITNTDGRIEGTVDVPVMPLGRLLRVLVFAGEPNNSENIVFSEVVGPTDSLRRTVTFSAPLMDGVALVVVDAELYEAAPSGLGRCTLPSAVPGCLTVRLD